MQVTGDSGVSEHMSKKLQILLPALKAQTGAEEDGVDLLPGENWAIYDKVSEFCKATIARSDLEKARRCSTIEW